MYTFIRRQEIVRQQASRACKGHGRTNHIQVGRTTVEQGSPGSRAGEGSSAGIPTVVHAYEKAFVEEESRSSCMCVELQKSHDDV